MFFYVSKITWFFIQPFGLLFALLFLTLATGISRRPRLAVLFAGLAMMLLVVCGWTNAGYLLLQPLEQRFARPQVPPGSVAAIIVLGGGAAGTVNQVRGGYELQDAGDRFIEAAILARRHPEARIVVSGGSGAVFGAAIGDADIAQRFFAVMGIATDRLILESRSRNTAENAAYTAGLVGELGAGTWLLVTSAFHMPRAVAVFRKAGIDVTPWPVDYRTTGAFRFGRSHQPPAKTMEETTLALREWIGLAAYRISGRIDSYFPGP